MSRPVAWAVMEAGRDGRVVALRCVRLHAEQHRDEDQGKTANGKRLVVVPLYRRSRGGSIQASGRRG